MDKYSQIEVIEEDSAGIHLFKASFDGNNKKLIQYSFTLYIMTSFFAILIYGLGILMLLYSPVVYYIIKEGIKNRKLYLTSENVVFSEKRPACCPCFGVNTSEKHVLLHLITDVTVQQGWLESCFGLYTLKIENPGQSGSARGGDLSISGIDSPQTFKKILLHASAAKRNGRMLSPEDIKSIAEGTGNESYQHQVTPGQLEANAGVMSNQNVENKLDALNGTMSRIEQLLSQQVSLLRGPARPPIDHIL